MDSLTSNSLNNINFVSDKWPFHTFVNVSGLEETQANNYLRKLYISNQNYTQFCFIL
jgi:hypothetical protein